MSGQAVLIAAADDGLRRALKTALATRLHIVVVGEAADRAEFCAAAERLQPDLVLLDWTLCGLCCNGHDEQCRACLAQTSVVVLTANEEHDAAARDAGATACFRKGANPDRLMDLIRDLDTRI